MTGLMLIANVLSAFCLKFTRSRVLGCEGLSRQPEPEPTQATMANDIGVQPVMQLSPATPLGVPGVRVSPCCSAEKSESITAAQIEASQLSQRAVNRPIRAA